MRWRLPSRRPIVERRLGHEPYDERLPHCRPHSLIRTAAHKPLLQEQITGILRYETSARSRPRPARMDVRLSEILQKRRYHTNPAIWPDPKGTSSTGHRRPRRICNCDRSLAPGPQPTARCRVLFPRLVLRQTLREILQSRDLVSLSRKLGCSQTGQTPKRRRHYELLWSYLLEIGSRLRGDLGPHCSRRSLHRRKTSTR